ncbi:hypothetical protein, partial [Roseinatronobacter sp.]|uniref:hypothetical protein n=1 Tax=Roseinatronobacter sp. TaxID=1945755 RepID=UPI0025D783B4
YTALHHPGATPCNPVSKSTPQQTYKPASTPSNFSAAGERYLGNTIKTRKREIHESVTFSNLPKISPEPRSNNAPACHIEHLNYPHADPLVAKCSVLAIMRTTSGHQG